MASHISFLPQPLFLLNDTHTHIQKRTKTTTQFNPVRRAMTRKENDFFSLLTSIGLSCSRVTLIRSARYTHQTTNHPLNRLFPPLTLWKITSFFFQLLVSTPSREAKKKKNLYRFPSSSHIHRQRHIKNREEALVVLF